MGRSVSAVVTVDGALLGAVGPFAVGLPWWSEVEAVVERLEDTLGVPVFVLRLLHVEGGDGARDGHVTYHVEALERPVRRWESCSVDHATLTAPQPLRSPWARIEGLRDLLGWASDALSAAGRPVTGPVEQRRTWNLAGLFRLPTETGPVWLKATPPFATDEAAVIAAFAQVDPGLVPTVVAAGDRRVLLEHLPGEDGWEVAPEILTAAVDRFVAAQVALAGHRPPRLPDRRTPVITGMVRRLLDDLPGLTAKERAAAHDLVGRWPALDDCGLPDTIVHGDFHPGNWRCDGGRPAVVDFADAHFGNPVLDGLRVCEFLPEAKRPIAVRAWVDAWKARRPGADPARALAIAAPLGHLVYAVRYQEFLDGIEPSERIYHFDDPICSVRAALAKSFKSGEEIALD
jgi:hypothetical protein